MSEVMKNRFSNLINKSGLVTRLNEPSTLKKKLKNIFVSYNLQSNNLFQNFQLKPLQTGMSVFYLNTGGKDAVKTGKIILLPWPESWLEKLYTHTCQFSLQSIDQTRPCGLVVRSESVSNFVLFFFLYLLFYIRVKFIFNHLK